MWVRQLHVRSRATGMLWLWRIHNDANVRLAPEWAHTRYQSLKCNHVYSLRELCVVIAARKCYIRLTRLVLNAANVRCFCLCLGACD